MPPRLAPHPPHLQPRLDDVKRRRRRCRQPPRQAPRHHLHHQPLLRVCCFLPRPPRDQQLGAFVRCKVQRGVWHVHDERGPVGLVKAAHALAPPRGRDALRDAGERRVPHLAQGEGGCGVTQSGAAVGGHGVGALRGAPPHLHALLYHVPGRHAPIADNGGGGPCGSRETGSAAGGGRGWHAGASAAATRTSCSRGQRLVSATVAAIQLLGRLIGRKVHGVRRPACRGEPVTLPPTPRQAPRAAHTGAPHPAPSAMAVTPRYRPRMPSRRSTACSARDTLALSCARGQRSGTCVVELRQGVVGVACSRTPLHQQHAPAAQGAPAPACAS